MEQKAISITAIVLTVLALVATICVFAFHRPLENLDVEMEALALGTVAFAVLGLVCGLLSLKTVMGKVAAVLGLLLVLLFAWVLFETDRNSTTAGYVSPASQPADGQTPAKTVPGE